jgi:aminopeptidase N
MKVGVGRSAVLGIATVAASLGFASAADAAKLPKFAVTNVSSPPATAEVGDQFTVLGVVKNRGKKGGKATIRVSLRSDNVPENGPVPLGMTTTDKVKKGESEEFSVPSEIPEYTEAGTYYMVVCATPAKGSGCLVASDQIEITDPPDFQPGARSAGDDLYPQTGNGGYDAEHYDIELIYDPVTNLFEAGTKTTMTATATQDLSEFTMDFQDIGVTSVTVNGVAADSYSHALAEPVMGPPATDLQKLVIDPPGPGIVEGTEMTVVVEYNGEPQVIVDPDESIEGWIPACYMDAGNEVCDGGYTVNEPNGAQGWFPSNNFPTDKATFDTAITVPEGLEAAGMGELVDHESDLINDTETWSWSEDDPTSTYLATATNGQFRYTTPTITESLTGRLIPQANFVEATATPAQLTSIDTAIGRTEEMHNWLANRFGTYPYDSNGIVADRVPGVCYALENATKSHFAGNCSTGDPSVSQSTLVHEIAHQWMGNAVTLENWDDIWFQEGWAQWVAWSWNFTDGTSTNSPGAQWNTNYQGPTDPKWNTIPTELNDDPVDLFATFPTYTRGAMTYEGYRQIVGTQKFFEFARELVERFKYDNVTSEQVVDLMIEISDFTGDDLALLEEYFDQWLYEAGRPTVTSDDFS